MRRVPLNIDLRGKTAIVTGGGGILCGSFSEALGRCGANVAVLDLRKDAAERVSDKINESGGKSLGIQADVLELESLVRAEKIITKEFGPYNILVNGAGGNHPKGTTSNEFLSLDDLKSKKKGLTTFFDLNLEGFEFVFDLNVIGTLLPTQVFAKKMVYQEGAIIINISSMNAFLPLTKIPAYSAAKAAVSNFTKWLAVHFSRVGIRVNAIAPGFFLTDQNQDLLINDDGTYTNRAEKILNQTPMQRFGKPSDLIGTLLWLVDEQASGFVNGIIIPVDGGFSAYSGI